MRMRMRTAALLAAVAGLAAAVYDGLSTAIYDVFAFVLMPLVWLFKAAKTPVHADHPLHETRAFSTALAAPFRAFIDRCRKSPTFIGDHFRTPAASGFC